MRLRILTPVLVFSILLFVSCTEEKQPEVMPVTTSSDLARKLYETALVANDEFKVKLAWGDLQLAVEQDPNFFMAYFWMYFISSEDSKTIVEKALQSDIQLNPAEEQVRSALKYLVDGQDEKAVEHLQNLVDMYPYDPHTHKILYHVQIHFMKDVEAAIVSMKRTIRECPDYADTYNQLGYAYIDQEQYDDAEKAFDTYIEKAPALANPYDSKGDYFMATKQYQEAYDSYMKAYGIDSGFEISKQKAEKAMQMLNKTIS
jgi:tetratricopeptide (TPR) repeat protein